ncbi:hypothetical protein NEOLEDRAFT_1051794, partial [Neolentinus lepideus HHB14362 ss-1]
LVKPLPPHKYDGTADIKIFTHFMEESLAFIEDGRLTSSNRWRYISHYMEDKALTFYNRSVSRNATEWSPQLFFSELFNYCFPLDFRQKMRAKLRYCRQGSKSVKDYIHEISELQHFVGVSDRQECVRQLWDGFTPDLQSGLIEGELSPEVNTWEQV